MKKIALLAIVSLSLIAMIANVAQAENLPSYAVLKAGVYSPEADDLDEFDSGFNGEAAFGTYIGKDLAVEIGINWFKTDVKEANLDADIETMSVLLLSLKKFYPIGDFEPYIFVGGGYYSVKADFRVDAGVPASDTVNAVGWHLGLGANYNITPRIFVGAEAKYLWADADIDIAGVSYDKVNIDGLMTTANVGFRF